MTQLEMIENIHNMAVTCTNYITFFVTFFVVAFVVWLIFKLISHLAIYF